MTALRILVVLGTGLAVSMGLMGCASNPDARDPSSNATAPASLPPEKERVPKKAALPDLPEGAGPIDEDAPEEFTRTPSGLYYRILRKSKGRKPRSFSTVLAHYRGWLNNGKQFDSSYDKGNPIEFPLTQVVPGWTEGLQLIGVGGMIELEVPARLGYGANGKPPAVPPNATLHFIVEMMEVK